MNKNIFLAPLLIVLFSFSLTLLIFSPVSFKNVVNAFTSKSTGDQLTVTDWNNLPSDFVERSGSTMSGSLNMGGNKVANLGAPTSPTDAVNLSYLSTALAGSSFQDVSGNPLKAVCGTTGGSWQDYVIATADAVLIDINIPVGTFLSTPVYFTSISGNAGHWRTTGASSIYNPSPTGFRIYINDLNSEDITPALVNNMISPGWGWVINWCAFGQ